MRSGGRARAIDRRQCPVRLQAYACGLTEEAIAMWTKLLLGLAILLALGVAWLLFRMLITALTQD
jgi:hypothetical protein